MARRQLRDFEETLGTLKESYGDLAHEQAHEVKGEVGEHGGAPAAGHKVGDLIMQNGHRYKATKVNENGKVLAADPLQ